MIRQVGKWAAIAAVLGGAYATGAGAGVAPSADAGTWVTDGPVYSIARLGDRTFIGGRFAHVGRRTGPGVALAPVGATESGNPSPGYGSFPEVSGGRVLAAASDRAGGWYIGGDFTHVGGAPRRGLARVIPDGAGSLVVDSAFDPRPAGAVHALALGATGADGGVLYVGGKFDSLAGDIKYRNFAAVRRSDGVPVGGWPAPDDTVRSIDVLRQPETGTSYPVVFIAGDFANVGTTPRHRVAAIWGAGAGEDEGDVTAFEAGGVDGVRAVRVGDARHDATKLQVGAPVYVAGDSGVASFKFTITEASREVAGAAYGASPILACDQEKEPGCAPRVRGIELSPDGETLYLGGRFDTVEGEPRRNLAAIRAVPDVFTEPAPDMAVRSWQPDPDGRVDALAHSDPGGTPSLYVGGEFENVLGSARLGLAAVTPAGTTVATDPADSFLLEWNPRVAGGIPTPAMGTVSDLAASAAGVYAGGSFTAAQAVAHENLAALDASGAPIGDWTASTDGAVFALAAGNDRLYLGGLFATVNGEPRSRLAAVGSAGSGALDAGFAPAADPECTGAGCTAPAPGVLSLALTDQALYVGGSFATLAGQSRSNAGAVHPTSGAALGWTPNPDGTVYALLATCGTVYAGGGFANAGGQPRSRIASLDPASGVATDWNPSANGGAVYALARDQNVVYAGGSFTAIGGTERKRLAAIDATSGIATAWSPSIAGTSDFVRALAVAPGGAVVHAGGQISAGGERSYAAEFDRATGDRTEWEPGADAPVRALVPAGDALLVGGEFRQLGGRMQHGFGTFGLAAATAGQELLCAPPEPPPPPPPPEPEPEPAPPPPEPAPRPAPYRDTVDPVLDIVNMTHARFRVTRTRAARARRRVPLGTAFRYTLSEPSVVRFAFARRTRARCASPSARRPCYRWRAAGSTGHLSRAGAVSVRFTGRVGRRTLAPGHYRVWVRAVDPAGNRSGAHRLGFEIVSR